MDSYQTRQHATVIDGIEYQIKSLKDRNQFYDPDGAAEKLGISSAMWPISGLLWPSGIVLARIIGQLPLNGLKVLEVGCGVALASLVALSKGADITACDYHPMTQQLLNDNTALNKLGQIKYFHGNWLTPITGQGPFDLIVGSDLLYERDHLEHLATFIHCHLAGDGKVILVDPGRKMGGKFTRIMSTLGFTCTQELLPTETLLGEQVRCRAYHFQRTGA